MCEDEREQDLDLRVRREDVLPLGVRVEAAERTVLQPAGSAREVIRHPVPVVRGRADGEERLEAERGADRCGEHNEHRVAADEPTPELRKRRQRTARPQPDTHSHSGDDCVRSKKAEPPDRVERAQRLGHEDDFRRCEQVRGEQRRRQRQAQRASERAGAEQQQDDCRQQEHVKARRAAVRRRGRRRRGNRRAT
jgi:hypothetical protein